MYMRLSAHLEDCRSLEDLQRQLHRLENRLAKGVNNCQDSKRQDQDRATQCFRVTCHTPGGPPPASVTVTVTYRM